MLVVLPGGQRPQYIVHVRVHICRKPLTYAETIIDRYIDLTLSIYQNLLKERCAGVWVMSYMELVF